MNLIKHGELPHYTYEDYKHWEGKWELIEGIPYAMSPSLSWKHQAVSSRIAWQLEERLKNCPECISLISTDWKISEDTVVQPDNLVICYRPKTQYLTRAPVLIFEVLSKSTALKDTTVKFRLYEKEGVKYYILVEPEDRVAKIFSLREGRYVKLRDVNSEKVAFTFEKCSFEFDFSLIWID